MDRTWFKFGLISGGVMVSLFIITHILLDINDPNNYGTSELIGYTTMVLSLVAIFFGIRHYKHEQSDGILTLKTAIVVGLQITLVASFFFGVYSYVLMEFITPEFLDSYYGYYVDTIKNSQATEAVKQAQLNEMKEMEWFIFNTFLQSLLMFVTVFLIGGVITLISSFILKTPTPKNA